MDYADRNREDQRLLILRALNGAADYTAHEHMLREALADAGSRVSADQLRGHLAWLDEQGLIVLTDGRVQIATLTLRGSDVATGAARCPGVGRPLPMDRR